MIPVSGRTGEFMPLYCTAHGKALLADTNLLELRSIFGDQPFEKHTGATVSNIDELAAACAKIRPAGDSLDDGEYLPEVRCLAAPNPRQGGYRSGGHRNFRSRGPHVETALRDGGRQGYENRQRGRCRAELRRLNRTRTGSSDMPLGGEKGGAARRVLGRSII